jgi:hypothetical protein
MKEKGQEMGNGASAEWNVIKHEHPKERVHSERYLPRTFCPPPCFRPTECWPETVDRISTLRASEPRSTKSALTTCHSGQCANSDKVLHVVGIHASMRKVCISSDSLDWVFTRPKHRPRPQNPRRLNSSRGQHVLRLRLSGGPSHHNGDPMTLWSTHDNVRG